MDESSLTEILLFGNSLFDLVKTSLSLRRPLITFYLLADSKNRCFNMFLQIPQNILA